MKKTGRFLTIISMFVLLPLFFLIISSSIIEAACWCNGTTRVCDATDTCKTYQYNPREIDCIECTSSNGWDYCVEGRDGGATGWIYECCKNEYTYDYNSPYCTGDDDDPIDDDDDDDDPIQCIICTPLACLDPVTSSAPVNPPFSATDYFLDNLYSCLDGEGCDPRTTRYTDCYEILSPQPDPSILPHHELKETTLGFVSETYTGAGRYSIENGDIKDDRVNDGLPIINVEDTGDNEFYMEATFKDGDQIIEAVYFWFSKSSEKPVTPKVIDLDGVGGNAPKTQNDESFGFMLHKEGNSWIPYIGSGEKALDVWKKASYSNNIFAVKGPGRQDMVNVILNQNNITVTDSGKKVVVKSSLSFKEKSSPYSLLDVLKGGKYNIWLMANDTFGFTPHDNYNYLPNNARNTPIKNAIHNKWITNERIRYYNQWIDSGEDWNIDFESPNIENFTIGPATYGKTIVSVAWQFVDDIDFSTLVLNILESEDSLVPNPIVLQKIVSDGGATYIDSKFPFNPPMFSTDEEVMKNLNIGHLNYNLNKYAIKMSGGTGNVRKMQLELDLGEVGQGYLYFYLTAFDKGGNVARGGYVKLDTRDWIVTYGGLLYSAGGSDFPVRTLIEGRDEEPLGWSTKNPPLNDIKFAYADLSSELVGEDIEGVIPVSPVKSVDTLNYHIPSYSVIDVSSYYNSLKAAFEKRKDSLNIVKPFGENVGTISGLLFQFHIANQGVPTQERIALIEAPANLTVNSDFNCNGKGIIFVNGNLTIVGKIVNGKTEKDACIFVVKGDVTIDYDGPVSGNEMAYDQINAYILADKITTITKEVKTYTSYDAIYVNGGLHSLEGFVIGRNLKIQDRLRFPALVVRNNSKYGVFAETLFGTEDTLQTTEVGYK